MWLAKGMTISACCWPHASLAQHNVFTCRSFDVLALRPELCLRKVHNAHLMLLSFLLLAQHTDDTMPSNSGQMPSESNTAG